MDNKNSKVFTISSWIALSLGVCCFAIGLYNATMQLNEKGYYTAILLLGVYSTVSLQKIITEHVSNNQEDTFYSIFTWVSFLSSITLLVIGLYNAELQLSEKGFFGIAYFLCLFGIMSVHKSMSN